MSSNLTRFNPFNDIARFKPFSKFEDFFNDFSLAPALRDFELEPRIKMDVMESDKAYQVKAEIPGVRKEDIKVDINGNQVSISAETRRQTEEKEGACVVRSECYYGQKYRSFTLGQEIDDAKAEARYQDGVLELNLPKKSNGGGAKKLVVK
ncbi:MAG: Hsp20/alpha crystallin family protein [Burkholderiales bacterium]|nr:Hsp20/alpha crystallin family protein [Burkholderiales bacterium]